MKSDKYNQIYFEDKVAGFEIKSHSTGTYSFAIVVLKCIILRERYVLVYVI